MKQHNPDDPGQYRKKAGSMPILGASRVRDGIRPWVDKYGKKGLLATGLAQAVAMAATGLGPPATLVVSI